MIRRSYPVFSTILYVLAALLGIYTLWAVYFHYNSISNMVNTGQVTISGNEFELVSYLMGNIAQYAIFAVILLSLGIVLQNRPSDEFEYVDDEDYEDEDFTAVEDDEEGLVKDKE
jgi:type III secretory pathway component EscT